MTNQEIEHTCPRCGGQKVKSGTYTGVCLTCFDRRWEEARGDGYIGSHLTVVSRESECGASEENPLPFPEVC
jgi:hypothetical protein